MSAVDLKGQVSEIATCPICLEDFVDAKSLPCLHSFCLKCLEGHCTDKFPGNYANCPVCRTEFRIPGNGIRGLPHNFMLKKLVDAKKSTGATGGKPLCDVCMKDDADEMDDVPLASVFCVNCRQNLCKPCSRPHRNNAGGSHQLNPISPEDDVKLRKRIALCEKHGQKRMELYCIDCKVTLCVKCLILGHSQHRCAEIEEVREIFSRQIDDDIKQVRERMYQLKAAESKVEAQSRNFRLAVERVNHNIFEKGRERKNLVDKHVHELQREVGRIQADALSSIDTHEDDLSVALVKLESYSDYATDLKTNGSATDIILLANKLHTQASELLQSCVVPGVDSMPAISFTPSHIIDDLVQGGENIIGTTSCKGIPEPDKASEKPATAAASAAASDDACCQQSEEQKEQQLNYVKERLDCVEKQFQALTDYIHCDWSLTDTINTDYEVRGIASLYGKLDVLDNTQDQQISIFDMRDGYKQMERYLHVPSGELWDIVASRTNRCLYVSNFIKKEVYKVAIPTGYMTEWDVCGYEPRGLSILLNGNLLVACRTANALVELNANMAVGRIVPLHGIQRPWHAIQLSSGNFALSHGSGRFGGHQVCIIDVNGHRLRTYGDCMFGPDRGQLNIPCHLAVDANDFVFVADCLNARVTLLTPTLQFVRHVRENMDSRPQRLCLDNMTKRLHIGQKNGDILVIDVQ